MLNFSSTSPVILDFYVNKAIPFAIEKWGEACDVVDGSAEGAFAQAAFENTQYTLNEIACRPVGDGSELALKRGHGCDGIDNNCNSPIKLIDECEEDVFPPDMTVKAYPEGWFSTADDAKAFLENSVTAMDDCMPVSLSWDGTSEKCGATWTATATAEGCGSRPVEDVTTMSFPVKVDGVAPTVSCSLGVQGLEANGLKQFADVGFQYDAYDECSESLEVEILVESDEMENTPSALLSNGMMPSIYVRQNYCDGQTGKGVDDCLVPSSPAVKARYYKVTVKVTDEAGNVGIATCDTSVAEKAKGNKAGAEANKTTLWPIASRSFTFSESGTVVYRQ